MLSKLLALAGLCTTLTQQSIAQLDIAANGWLQASYTPGSNGGELDWLQFAYQISGQSLYPDGLQVGYYVSTDAIIATSDILLRSDHLDFTWGSIGYHIYMPDPVYFINTNPLIPHNVNLRTGIILDHTQHYSETNESNNTFLSPMNFSIILVGIEEPCQTDMHVIFDHSRSMAQVNAGGWTGETIFTLMDLSGRPIVQTGIGCLPVGESWLISLPEASHGPFIWRIATQRGSVTGKVVLL